MAMLTASCHCGAVQITIMRKPRKLTRCTCSVCRRYGALWAYGSRKTVKIRSKPGAAIPYLWNDRVLEFYHCSTCGCLTHYESTDKSPDGRIAVNARMMSPADIAGIRIRTFDGAETWKYID